MNIFVNGEATEISSGSTVAAFLESLRLKTDKVAVERNGDVTPRALHAQTVLCEGDRIEIIHFIGGG